MVVLIGDELDLYFILEENLFLSNLLNVETLLNINASLVANIGFNATTIEGSFGTSCTSQITMWPQMALHRKAYIPDISPFQIYFFATSSHSYEKNMGDDLYAGGVLSKLCQLPFCRR